VTTKIKPTVGRVVWYYPNGKMDLDAGAQPWAATIAYVHSDTCVNLGLTDPNGNHGAATSVALVQEEDPIPHHAFCTWMPYQIGQAAKTEHLSRVAEAARRGFHGET